MRGAMLCVAAIVLLGGGGAFANTEVQVFSSADADVQGQLFTEVQVADVSDPLDDRLFSPYESLYPGEEGWNPAVATWVHGSWPTVEGAIWISNTYLIEEPIAGDSWRWFRRIITLPVGAFDISGQITACTADNAEVVYVNGSEIGRDGEIHNPYQDNHEWGTVKTYDIDPSSLLHDGENEIAFLVRNYPGSSDPKSNPTGLIYKGSIGYSVVTSVEIDIKPGSYPNSINLGSAGVIPVAIFGSEDFDVTMINISDTEEVSGIVLAGASVRIRGNGKKELAHYEYVNDDGYLDLVVQFDMENLTLTGDETEAIVDGFYWTGSEWYPFSGTDTINIVP